MKLRTSFFNPTVFKKDLTRFAPTWVLYTVGLFMMMAICLNAPYDYRKARELRIPSASWRASIWATPC